jgi:CubicO group peptidase (beta-lactamase class C family)
MRAFLSLAALSCATFLSTSVSAQVPAGKPLETTDLEAWLDGFMPFSLARGDIAGAVVVVVKDGQVMLQKGYGYADVAEQKPVDPENTLFRPGSVSKLFTWTAVMQQVERGKLDLDTDVNQYLDFALPPGPGGKPITLRNIMTHTAGFEELVKELITTDITTLPKLGDLVRGRIPARIFEPGTTPAYSNYATAVAGYLVERTSGLSFDDYLDQNIFGPLGMTKSSFRQPLPEALMANMSKGYKLGSDDKPGDYELIGLAPAGALASTGADMGKFMIAHLQKGAYGETRILSAETAELMHTSALTLLPPLNRMVLGFYETNINGHRAISHGGDTMYFHSNLHLFLDDGVGLYISMNSTGREGAAGPLRSGLYREFADRYFPGPPVTGTVDEKTAAEHTRLISGNYVLSRRLQTNLISILNLTSGVKVFPNDDGSISVSILNGPHGKPSKWREVAPFVWKEDGDNTRLAAEVVDGKVTRFSFDDFAPIIWFQRAPAATSPAWMMPATVASLAILLLTAIAWPVAALIRRRYRQPHPYMGRELRAYRWVRIGALASALAIIAWGGLAITMLENLTSMMNSALDPWLIALHILGSIAVFVGLALAIWHLIVVWTGKRRWISKIWSVLLVLATAILAWLAVSHHLVGLGVDY